MRRLSRTQYQTVLQDLVQRALPRDGASIAAELPGMLQTALYPEDKFANLDGGRRGGILRTDQALQQAHVDASYGVAVKLAAELTNSPARINQLLGACAGDADASNDDACLRGFIEKFGRLALRRPLEPTDVDFYRNIAGATPVAALSVANVIALVLTAPDLFYSIEIGKPTAEPGRLALTPHELSARLALHFWNSIPSAELDALADSGDLLKPDVYAAQVAKLVADPRAEGPMREFFSQWFRLQETSDFDSRLGDPTYKALIGAFAPTAQTRQGAIDEVDAVAKYVYQNHGSLKDILLDNHAVAQAPDIASLYGVSAWDGVSVPATLPGRNLLTRVAFVATGLSKTRPIMKGVRILNGLLCQVLPPPPPAAMNAVVELSPDLTTREVVEKLTGVQGCSGCHEALINPFGFMTENFDPVGRPRTVQQLFDANGNPTVQRPIHTDATINVAPGGPRQVSGVDEGLQYILESGQLEACFAQQYTRFALGRKEADFDQYVIAQVGAFARNGSPLSEVMQQVALRPEFQTRMSQ